MSPYCSYTAHFSRQVIPKTFVTVDYIDYIHEDYHCEIRCKSVHGRYWVKWVKYNIQPFSPRACVRRPVRTILHVRVCPDRFAPRRFSTSSGLFCSIGTVNL